MLAGFAGRLYNGAAIEQEQEAQGRQGLLGGWDAQNIPQPPAFFAAGFVKQAPQATAHVALAGRDTMDTWESALVALGGSAVLLGVVAWLARSLIGQLLSKDIEGFKAELSAASGLAAERTKHDLQLATERTKHELQLAAQERSVLFTKLHEKRAHVIADLYGLLVETQWAAQDFASPMEWAGEPNKREKYSTALNKSAEFFRFFDKHRIYLPKDLCERLEEFLRGMRGKVIGFGVYISRDEDTMTDDGLRKKHEAWMEASSYFDIEVPKARKALESELRQLIGATEHAS